MQPTAEFKNQLFGTHQDRIRECFFGHVVNEEALLPLAIAKGPTGVRFLFNFANRDNKLVVCIEIQIKSNPIRTPNLKLELLEN